MKIWLINHYATRMFTDKAGRHYGFAKRLTELGHNATVFCSTTFLNSQDAIETNGKKYVIKETDNIPFVFVSTLSSQGNGFKRIISWYFFYKNLFPVTKEYVSQYGKPDVIVASSVHPLTMVAGIKIAKKLKVPCICEIRDLWPEAIFQFGKAKEKSLIGKLMISGEHWIYKNADALIFTKEGDTDYLKEKRWTTAQGGDVDLSKCHYINNGIDMIACEERSKSMRLDDPDLKDETKFNVTYVGTIRPVNNVGNLLDVAKILKEAGNSGESGNAEKSENSEKSIEAENTKDTKDNKTAKHSYDDVQFLIYGDGIQLSELQKRVKNEHIDNVKLKGFINRQYVPYILSRSDINMLNYAQNQYNWSRGNSSNKLFEYMASGKPIISTVHMGYSIIKKYNCGVELDEDTPEALAQEIMHFHDMKPEERKQIGENAKNGAKDFDFKVLTDKLMKVIDSVVVENSAEKVI